MATLTWADIAEISHDEAKQSLLEQLDAVGFRATSWQEGDAALATVEMVAEVWHQLSKVAVYIKESALNDTAAGEALTRFAASHYDNQREGAVPAQRRVTLACATGSGPHTFNASDIVIAHPDGPTYRLIDNGDPGVVFPVTLVGGGSQPDLIFEAEVAGSEANKPDTTVNQLVTTLAGVTVAADQSEREGSDEELDRVLRLRNTTKWALLTQYELIDDAVINICLDATQSVTGVVVDSSNPRGAGTFDVYMAEELDTAGAGDIALAQAAIDARVFGSTATPKTALVKASPVALLSLTGTVYYKGGYTSAEMSAATDAALEEFIKAIPLGGYDYYPGPSNVVPINDVEAVIRGVTIGDVYVKKTVVLNSPVDLSVAAFGKVTPGAIILNYVQTT